MSGIGGRKLLSGDLSETFRIFGDLDSADGGGDLKPLIEMPSAKMQRDRTCELQFANGC